MSEGLERRINSMLVGDSVWAWGFVIVLWLTYAYVFFAINNHNSNGSIRVALIIGGALVVIYNTASIFAMVRHYKEDKHAIYGIDIQHLDEMRAAKSSTTNR